MTTLAPTACTCWVRWLLVTSRRLPGVTGETRLRSLRRGMLDCFYVSTCAARGSVAIAARCGPLKHSRGMHAELFAGLCSVALPTGPLKQSTCTQSVIEILRFHQCDYCRVHTYMNSMPTRQKYLDTVHNATCIECCKSNNWSLKQIYNLMKDFPNKSFHSP